MILKNFSELPPRKRIGILAIVLGVLAVVIGSPYQRATAKVNLKEMAILSNEDISSISTEELSDWIIKGNADYRLVDLRSSKEHEEYNIPSSESIPVSDLLNSSLMKNEKIILYSDDDIIASQAWFILRASEYKGVYILKKGMTSWKEDIIFPSCNCGENPSIEQRHLHSKKSEIAKFFGGKISSGNAPQSYQNSELPKLEAPKKVILKSSRKKKKREGC